MNPNYAYQNAGALGWDGTAAYPVDVRGYIGYAFTFNATADITTDAVFKIQSAPPSGADPCAPGTFADVPEVLTCVATWGAVPGPTTTITIPAGTKKGQRCTGAIPCPVGPFIQMAAVSGDTAKMRGIVTLHGPTH